MPYVVTEPESIRGVYDSWAECQATLAGVSGVRYQKVKNREEAEAILAGTGVVLPPGLYAFTDGNDLGGVGVVVVRVADNLSAEPDVVQEIATSVDQIFNGAAIPGLESEHAIRDALQRLANILAEMAGLYAALGELPEGVEVRIVHDYEGVGAFMQEGRWRAKDPIVRAVVSASRELAESRDLRLEFLHQRGHMSTWAGRRGRVGMIWPGSTRAPMRWRRREERPLHPRTSRDRPTDARMKRRQCAPGRSPSSSPD